MGRSTLRTSIHEGNKSFKGYTCCSIKSNSNQHVHQFMKERGPSNVQFVNAVFHEEVHEGKKAFKCQMLGTWTIPITGHALCVYIS